MFRDSFWRIYFAETVAPFEEFNTSFKYISKGFFSFLRELYKLFDPLNNILIF